MLKRSSKIICAFMALMMILTLMPEINLTALAEAGDPKIVASGFSVDSASANAAIAEALKQNEINESVTIPDGCWNIGWVVLDQALSDNQSVFLATKRNTSVQKYAGDTGSNYESENTAGKRVFWFAGYAPEDVLTPYKISSVNNVANRDKIFFGVYDGTLPANGKTLPSATLESLSAQTEDMTFSVVKFQFNSKVITYTDKSGAYVFPATPSGGNVLIVPAGETFKPAEVLVAKQAGYIFKGYVNAAEDGSESFDAEKGEYTAPAETKETITLNPDWEEAQKHNITIEDASNENGTVTVNPEGQASEGFTVTITANPNTGYTVGSVEVTCGDENTNVETTAGRSNTWTFVMPTKDVKIKVTFLKLRNITTKVNESAGGKATTNYTTNVKPGTEVKLTITTNRGYVLSEVKVSYGDNKTVELTDNGSNYTFIMPEDDVTVDVTFKEKDIHNITINSAEYGEVTATVANTAKSTTAYSNDVVTLNIKPQKGYILKSLEVLDGESKPIEVTIVSTAKNTFVMPESDVTVNVAFEEAQAITVLDVAPISDHPGVNGFADKNGKHYDPSDAEDPENPIVKNYGIGKPTVDEDGVIHYTLTAEDLRMFAGGTDSDFFTKDSTRVSGFYYYIVGIAASPCDGGNANYSVRYTPDPAKSRASLDSASLSSASWSTASSEPVKIYFELDPNNLDREYWFRIRWTYAFTTVTEDICITIDGNCLPIRHFYEIPDDVPAGFVGENVTTTSYGEYNSRDVLDGYDEIRTPEQLGWIVPPNWTWHWEIDGNPQKTITSDKFVSKISDLRTDVIGNHDNFYDFTFKLVIDKIPQYAVTLEKTENGSIRLTPAAEKNLYNFGAKVTVRAVPDAGYDFSTLTVNGEDMTTKAYNGEYSFVVSGPMTVGATFVKADGTVTSVTVNGLIATHIGEHQWNISLPWNNSLPDDSGAGIKFNFASSGTAKLEKAETKDEKTKVFTYKIGEATYTVTVTIAERRSFKLKVDMKGTFEPVSGITGTGVNATVSESIKVEMTLIPGFGYALPENISVSVDDVILTPKEYSYDYKTGKLTIPALKVTGEVSIIANCPYGTVPVQISAGHDDIVMLYYDTTTNKNIQITNPTYQSDLPRTGDAETAIQQTNIAAASWMIPSENQQSSGGSGGNPYQWIIPKWLEFEGWYVNQDANGNHVEEKDQYTKLTPSAVGDKSFPFTPNPKNPMPVIEARWTEKPTYTLTVTLMPQLPNQVGYFDVYYGGTVDEHAPDDLWKQVVTEENAMRVTAKAAQEDTLKLYIPETYYEMHNHHFNQWVDENGTPVEMSESAITITYVEALGTAREMTIYAQWSEDAKDYEIDVVYDPGEHGIGSPVESSLGYTIDVGNNMYPIVMKLLTPEECGFEAEEGWEFIGWMIEGDTSGKIYTESVTTDEFAATYSGGATFIAQWKKIELVDINYTVKPGEGVTGEDAAKVLGKDEEVRTITLPTTKEEIAKEFNWTIPENTEFLNWTFETETSKEFIVNEEAGANRTEPFHPTEGMVITATWAAKDKVETWELDYDANGGEAGEETAPVLIHRVESDDEDATWTVEIGECTFEAPEGKEFGYWTINGRRVSPDSLITLKKSDVEDGKIVVKAVWRDIPDTVIKVYFRDGGGTGFMQSQDIVIAWNEESATFTFPSCAYTNDDETLTFAGWKYTLRGVWDGTPDSRSDGKIYQPGTVITVKQNSDTETITSIELEAQWAPRSSIGGGTVPTPGIGTGAGAGVSAGTANLVETPDAAEMPAHGGVSTDVERADSGETVTVLPAPDKGYVTGKVVVTDKDGNAVEVKSNHDGTYSFVMPAGGVTVTAEFVDASDWYTDVGEKAWYRNDVAVVSNFEMMTGTGEHTFSPKGTANRVMLMTILARHSSVPGSWDGGDKWYKVGMDWAVEEGISDGSRPFEALTREEIVTMLYRYVDSPRVSGSTIRSFKDGTSVASWAADAMEWAVETGVIKGYDDGTIGAKKIATRAELAAILNRVMELVDEF